MPLSFQSQKSLKNIFEKSSKEFLTFNDLNAFLLIWNSEINKNKMYGMGSKPKSFTALEDYLKKNDRGAYPKINDLNEIGNKTLNLNDEDELEIFNYLCESFEYPNYQTFTGKSIYDIDKDKLFITSERQVFDIDELAENKETVESLINPITQKKFSLDELIKLNNDARFKQSINNYVEEIMSKFLAVISDETLNMLEKTRRRIALINPTTNLPNVDDKDKLDALIEFDNYYNKIISPEEKEALTNFDLLQSVYHIYQVKIDNLYESATKDLNCLNGLAAMLDQLKNKIVSIKTNCNEIKAHKSYITNVKI